MQCVHNTQIHVNKNIEQQQQTWSEPILMLYVSPSVPILCCTEACVTQITTSYGQDIVWRRVIVLRRNLRMLNAFLMSEIASSSTHLEVTPSLCDHSRFSYLSQDANCRTTVPKITLSSKQYATIFNSNNKPWLQKPLEQLPWRVQHAQWPDSSHCFSIFRRKCTVLGTRCTFPS